MSKRMLIDAAHREETRVVVADGNKIEDFDFESEAKRQIKGNIYLARVTRVEPSLQAAFVEYGGNRHGFMAFSEIHPDYYQIPVADRERLVALQAEAEAKRAAAEAALDGDDEDDEKTSDDTPRPARGRRRRGRRSGRTRADAEDLEADAGADGEIAVDGEDIALSDEATAADETPAEVVSEEEAPLTPEQAEEESKSVTALLESAGVSVLALDDADLEGVEWTDEEKTLAEQENEAEASEDEEVEFEDIEPLDPTVEEIEDISDDDDDGDDTEALDDTGDEGSEDDDSENGDSAEALNEYDDAADTSDEASEDGEAKLSTDGEAAPEEGARRGRRGRGGRGRSSNGRGSDRNSRGGERSNSRGGGRSNGRSGGGRSGGRSGGGRSGGGRGRRSESDLDQDPRPFFKNYKIQEVMRRRQVLLIQVVKEERGNKGAALTTYLSLAGRYCVLMPNTARGGGISRKITNMSDRRRLKTIVGGLDVPKGMGLIVRTAGANRTKAEITRDYDYLIRLWSSIRDLTLKSAAPSMIYEEGNLIKRSIRDLYSKDLDEVLVEGETAYKEAKAFMRMLMPSHARNVKLYRERVPLFQRYKVDVPLDTMLSPRVDMPSGGYIIINQTEALVAIDVNSGRSTREHNIEDTATKTNLEAADEVAKQLRMRDLAGLIVIDFIDMEENRNNRAVESRLKDALQHDRARLQVGRISNFGLLEMSRQRLRAGILEGSTRPCPHCEGAGIVRSVESSALRILRACGEEAGRERSATVTVSTNQETANFILNHKRHQLVDFEDHYGMRAIITVDPALTGDDFDVSRGEALSEARRAEIQSSATVSLDSAYLAEEEAKDAEAEARAQAEEDANEAELAQVRAPRGRRGSKKAEVATDKSDNAEEVKADAESSDENDEELDENGEPRRRRRGRRGGKRNRRRRERSEGDDAETSSENGDAPADAVASESSEAKDADNEVSEESPRPRRRRSRTRSDTAAAPSDDGGDVAVAEAPAEAAAEAPAKAAPKRARKSRAKTAAKTTTKTTAKAAKKTTTKTTAKKAAKTATKAAAEKPTPTADSSAQGAAPADGSGGDKKGWWQKIF